MNGAWIVLIVAVAASYGWGMRGTIIGGEKGAVLPGALIGLFLALLSGEPVLADNWFVFAAAGAMGMAYGGFETYAETMEKVICHDKASFCPKKGYVGLALKGANWFGIFGALLGMSFTAMTGKYYRWFDFVVLFALVPFIQLVGIRLFNKPYDPDKGIFPKLYFSRSRREEWGGNLLTLAALIVLMAVRGDMFALGFCLVAAVSGALGWVLAIWLYDITCHPLKSGRYILGRLQTNGYVDNWKIMEFSLGVCGGIGSAVYFVMSRGTVSKLALSLTENGFWQPLGRLAEPLAWASFTLILLMSVQYLYEHLKKRRGEDTGDMRAFELLDRAVCYALPPALIFLGDVRMAKLVVVGLIVWVLTEKNIFERFRTVKFKKLDTAAALLIFAAAVAFDNILTDGLSLFWVLAAYTVLYIISEILHYLNVSALNKRRAEHPDKKDFRKSFGSLYTVNGFFILQTAFLFAVLYRLKA